MSNNDEAEPFNDFVTSSLGFPKIKQAVAVEMERPLGGVHFKPDTLSFNYKLPRGVCVAKTSKKMLLSTIYGVTIPSLFPKITLQSWVLYD